MRKKTKTKKGRRTPWGILIGMALLIDILQFVLLVILVGLIVAPILSVFTAMVYLSLFTLFRTPISRPTFYVTSLVETIPIISSLIPMWTIGISLLAVSAKRKSRKVKMVRKRKLAHA